MYYTPKLANGKPAPLFWPIRVSHRLNHVFWPLEEDVPMWMRVLDRVAMLFGFVIFQYYNEAEIRYLWENLSNIDVLLSGVPTYVVLVDVIIRGFLIGWSKDGLQQVLKRFYAEIYVDEKLDENLYKNIDRLLIPTKFYSVLYLIALSSLATIPIINAFLTNRKDTLYKMSFTYDFTPNYIYIPLTIAGLYVGIIVTTILYTEGYISSAAIYHLNGRFLLLRRDLNARVSLLLKKTPSDCVASNLKHEVITTVKRHVQLMEFATQMQQEFSSRFFVNFLFSGILFCALCFKTYTNPTESIGFVIWMMAKLLEMLCMGHVGSTIRETTDKINAMYYECGWEAVIARSNNCRENVVAMKVIVAAMELYQKPIILSGLGFFTLSLEAVVSMLKATGSLFSCLIAVR